MEQFSLSIEYGATEREWAVFTVDLNAWLCENGVPSTDFSYLNHYLCWIGADDFRNFFPSAVSCSNGNFSRLWASLYNRYCPFIDPRLVSNRRRSEETDCLDWRLSLIVLGHIGGETLAKDGLLLMMHPNLSEQNIQARQPRVDMSIFKLVAISSINNQNDCCLNILPPLGTGRLVLSLNQRAGSPPRQTPVDGLRG